MAEPLLDSEKFEIDFCTIKVNSDDKIPEGKTLNDFLVKVKLDTFQWYSVDKQMKRLISTNMPKYVNLLCFGLSQNKKGKYLLETCSSNLADFQKGYFNPNLKESTVEKVKKHFETFRGLYHKRVMRE